MYSIDLPREAALTSMRTSVGLTIRGTSRLCTVMAYHIAAGLWPTKYQHGYGLPNTSTVIAYQIPARLWPTKYQQGYGLPNTSRVMAYQIAAR